MAIAQQVQELWPELEWQEAKTSVRPLCKSDSYLANESA